jgi:hypothetical protein
MHEEELRRRKDREKEKKKMNYLQDISPPLRLPSPLQHTQPYSQGRREIT